MRSPGGWAPTAPWVLLAALVALSAGAAAQASTVVSLAMSADATGFTLDPEETAESTITLRNDGRAQGNVRLDVVEEGDGWAAEVAPPTVTIPAGQTATVTLTVRAPSSRDGVATTFLVTVRGTITDQAGLQGAPAEVSFANALTPPPPPPPPPEEFPWAVALGAAGIVLVATGAGVGVALWRRESGIAVTVPGDPRDARPGYDAFVPIEVRNESDRSRMVKIEVGGTPPGWAAAPSLATLTLEPRASSSLWLAVRPPLDAPEGAVRLEFRARPAEARWRRIKIPVTVHVASEVRVTERLGAELQAQPYHPPGAP